MFQAGRLMIVVLVNAAAFPIVGMMWTAKMKKTLLTGIAAVPLSRCWVYFP